MSAGEGGVPFIEIEGASVADRLGLAVDDFRRLMAAGKVSVLCERGTDGDAGTWRATFYHGARRARLRVDTAGRILGDA